MVCAPSRNHVRKHISTDPNEYLVQREFPERTRFLLLHLSASCIRKFSPQSIYDEEIVNDEWVIATRGTTDLKMVCNVITLLLLCSPSVVVSFFTSLGFSIISFSPFTPFSSAPQYSGLIVSHVKLL